MMGKQYGSDADKVNNSGFTLVEVLVAMAVLAIVSIPILSTFANSAITNAKARRIENANTVVNDIIEEAKSTPMSELKSGKGTSYTYDLTEDSTDKGIYTGTVTNDSNGDYFIGLGNEKFTVDVSFDSTYYTDGEKSDQIANVSANNINSSGVSIYNDISEDGCFIYRDSISDAEAIKYFKDNIESTKYSEAYIHKTTDITVDLAKVDYAGIVASNAPVYVQILTIATNYEFWYNNDSTTPYSNKYSRTVIYQMNKFTAKAHYDTDNNIDYYIVSSASEYTDNLKKIYIFYTPFNKSVNSGDYVGTNNIWCDDKINIIYNYNNVAGTKPVYFEGSEVYLLEQVNYNDLSGNRIMNIKKNNVKIITDYGKLVYDGDTNSKTFTGNSPIVSTTPTVEHVYANNKYKTIIYSNVKNWMASNTKSNVEFLMYKMNVKVYYKGKLIAESTSTKIE